MEALARWIVRRYAAGADEAVRTGAAELLREMERR
jgi:hypothetical protein